MSARVALVTGASRGIGAATAQRLARDGFDLGVNFRERADAAEEVLESIRVSEGTAVPVRGDVSRPAECARVVAETVAALGRLDVLVNNAGVYERASFDGTTPEAWDRRLAVNLGSCFHMAKAAVPEMRKVGGGRIVNVSTQLAFLGSPHGVEYVSSKAGIVGLTRALARELAKDGILVNAVAPGAIDTDIIAGDTPAKRAERERGIPLRRVGRPEEVAAAIAFLVGPGGDYITGQVLHVNGGAFMG